MTTTTPATSSIATPPTPTTTPTTSTDFTLEQTIYLQDTYGFDEDDLEDLWHYYEQAYAAIGFENTLHDHRYIVKLYDIYYYTYTDSYPDAQGRYDMTEDTFNRLFDDFANMSYNTFEEDMRDIYGIDTRLLLSSRSAGSYRPFQFHIQSITEENALEVAAAVYNEGLIISYIEDYVTVVNAMMDYEKHYFDYWLDYLRDNDFPDSIVNRIMKRRDDAKTA